MTICDFYRACLSMQPKTSIRVYDKERCIYTGEYGNLPYTLAKHEFETLIVKPNMEWNFYLTLDTNN